VAVRSDREDNAAEIDAQWHRLAVEHGIIGPDGEFLVAVDGDWKRVRLADEWDLAGSLAEHPGRPEFLTLSVDGDALLGVTTKEHEVRLIAVGGVRERREAEARREAAETPEEREQAWEDLFTGPRPTDELLHGWADGLAFHSSAPKDVLHGLVGHTQLVLHRPLPAHLVDPLIDDPYWRVRQIVADVQPNLSTAQWDRLILDAEPGKRRQVMLWTAIEKEARITDAAHERLAADPDPEVRVHAAYLPSLPDRLLPTLLADPDAQVRGLAVRAGWERLDDAARQRLMTDSDPDRRRTALKCHHRDHPLPLSVFLAEDFGELFVRSCPLQRDLAEYLAGHEDVAFRLAAAQNEHLDPDLVWALGQDPDDEVRHEIALRPELTEEQRAAVRVDIDPDTRSHELAWVRALHDDADAMRRLAASSHLLVRRSVARARRLPADVVERLARDENRTVRLFLAESCDDAPADLLMEVWQWWDGSLTYPGRPRSHPNFPRTDLLRYADDPNPRMRRLAPDDPESTAELVERLARDPSAEVRCRAARDPRLSVASAVRLLDDTSSSVRHAARCHPRLPARLLVRYLRSDRHTAAEVARHPGVPVSVMRRMVETVRAAAEEARAAEERVV
jgi:hypothetical protein